MHHELHNTPGPSIGLAAAFSCSQILMGPGQWKAKGQVGVRGQGALSVHYRNVTSEMETTTGRG